MPKSQPQRRDNMEDLPPPGYPTGSSPAKKPCCCPHTKKKGERGFIEGFINILGSQVLDTAPFTTSLIPPHPV
ncbi:hypothetical protein QJS04_geneDACA007407 [Acorus gramineus]|uniref:Uncharacterized protein n=1 Tax=Acorus gramineus TaxID=55184 RepID=A0AAV9BNK4_ACOGR|nr:hypothetical protein QJS04_geneDACA007407 [Acorus gramineus]